MDSMQSFAVKRALIVSPFTFPDRMQRYGDETICISDVCFGHETPQHFTQVETQPPSFMIFYMLNKYFDFRRIWPAGDNLIEVDGIGKIQKILGIGLTFHINRFR